MVLIKRAKYAESRSFFQSQECFAAAFVVVLFGNRWRTLLRYRTEGAERGKSAIAVNPIITPIVQTSFILGGLVMLRRYFCSVFICVGCMVVDAQAETRTWTDKSGKHKTKAELVSFNDSTVTLKRNDGKKLTLPLSKLSKADRDFLKNSKTSSAKSSTDDRTAIKQVGNQFVRQLGLQSQDGVAKLMSDTLDESAAEKLIADIPKPDRVSKKSIRKIVVNGDSASAEIAYRYRNRFVKHAIKLDRKSESWKINDITVNLGKEDERRLLLATSDSTDKPKTTVDQTEDQERNDLTEEFAASPKRDFTIPADATPGRVIEFIAVLNRSTPPRTMARAKRMEFDRNKYKAMRTSAEFILDSKDADKQQLDAAAQATLVSMSILIALEPKETSTAIAVLPKKFEDLGLQQYVRMSRSIGLQHEIRSAYKSNERRSSIERIVRHLDGKVNSRFDYDLAMLTARYSASLGPETAAQTHRTIAEVLANNKAYSRAADRMLATARRYELVGNEMELQGIAADGSAFDISQLRGKVVLVDFWATWCGPCIAEMPNILKNHKKYSGQGFEVVAVSVDRNMETLTKYIGENSPPWIVLADNHPKNPMSMSDHYGISAIPTTILVDADGKVITLNCRGARLGKELAKIFDKQT